MEDKPRLPSGPDIEVRPRNWLLPVALVVLREESSYGYELIERLALDFDFEHIIAGTLYRTLRRWRKRDYASPSGRAQMAAARLVGCTTSPRPAKPISTCGSKRLRNTVG
jgi:hypothetical protein